MSQSVRPDRRDFCRGLPLESHIHNVHQCPARCPPVSCILHIVDVACSYHVPRLSVELCCCKLALFSPMPAHALCSLMNGWCWCCGCLFPALRHSASAAEEFRLRSPVPCLVSRLACHHPCPLPYLNRIRGVDVDISIGITNSRVKRRNIIASALRCGHASSLSCCALPCIHACICINPASLSPSTPPHYLTAPWPNRPS